ncbi:LysM peptidoglycan-binding domain-containing protein [Cohnella boryungensis]|uniref:LysM peptidoglycan-binding domain-containing protein n=1 Tax=Cohnella boryungensis TaxID=768479 RepID=A0ABV8SGQ7_9BACL
MKIHMVKQGDTLYLIAKKYDVPLEAVVKANPEISNPDAIEVGMKVKIPSSPKSPVGVIHQHTVQQGDTLWKLSKAWGIQLTDMIEANPQLKNPNALLTGEVVNIPKGSHPGSTGTATMHDKASMGAKAETGKKGTAVQPQPLPAPPPVTITPTPPPVTVTPVQPPAPQPAPPPVQVLPAPETKPIYGIEIHEHVELTYPVGKAESPMPYGYGMPFPGVGGQMTGGGYGAPGSDGYGYGYGMQQPMVGGEAWHMGGHGYGYAPGMAQPSMGGEMTGYGMPQPVLGMQGAYPGCAQPYGLPPLEGQLGGTIGGLYGMQDYSYSPPEAMASSQSPAAGGKPSGCKTCGGSSSLNSYAGAGYPGTEYEGDRVAYGQMPSAVSPAMSGYGQMPSAVSPAMSGYGQMPSAVSPAMSGYGQMPSAVSPAMSGFPGTNPGAYYGTPMGELPVGYKQMTSPYYCEPYYGGFPPIPPMPGLPPMPPLREEEAEQRSLENEEPVKIKASADKKRQPSKPKARQANVQEAKPKRKENLPWINW